MTFQYISDIHLEHYKLEEIDKVIPELKADILILAGDIGYPEQIQYKTYIEKVSKIWKKVFVISGNHEYYQLNKKYNEYKTKEEIDLVIEDVITDFANVFFLNNSKIEFDYNEKKYVILGTTLFSDVGPTNYALMANMNDFRCIYKKLNDNIKTIHLLDYIKYYNEAKTFIEKELSYYKETEYNVVVVTHHSPSFQCIDDKYKSSKIVKAFYTDLEYLIKDIYCWIYGHTHSQKEISINGVQVVNNSIGYIDEIDLNKINLVRII